MTQVSEDDKGRSSKGKEKGGAGNFLQVILVSFSFMFIFTAFQTTGIIEETVLQSLRNESTSCINGTGHVTRTGEGPCPEGSDQKATFTGNGYVSLSIIYACFAIASWIAPSVVAISFPKWSMVLMSVVYVAFIASFLIPSTWLLYLLSALLGAAAAVLWTAQGTFLSWISTPDTITRNSGVFWSINQTSLFFGNLLVYWQLSGKTVLNSHLRATIFIPLTIVGTGGTVLLCFLKNLKSAPEEPVTGEKSEESSDELFHDAPSEEKLKTSVEKDKLKSSIAATAFAAFVDAIKLFGTWHMLLLSLCSIYTGLEYSFISGVYSTAVGNTKQLGADSKKYVGLVGILIGVGEVLGGSLFGLLGSRTTKKGRTPVVLLGAAVHFISFTSIYFNLPDDASLRETNEVSFFAMPSSSLALICAVLMGFGDACLQTQLIAIFASVYQDKSSAAFAIFRFTQSAASAVAFVTSSYLGIFYQMTVLFCSCIISSAAFFIVEWRTGQLAIKVKEELQDQQQSPEQDPKLGMSAQQPFPMEPTQPCEATIC